MGWFKRMLGLETLEAMRENLTTHVDLKTGKQTPTRETDAGKLFSKIANGVCPDCGSKKGFLEGPSGGMSTNIKCANEECGGWFNVTMFFDDGIAERIKR